MKITSCDCYNVEKSNEDDFIEVKLVDSKRKEYSVTRVNLDDKEEETLMNCGKYCQHCGKKIEVEDEDN